MKKFTLKFLFLTLHLFLLSCGYQKTEEDKYPELPIFPEHTNSNISITPFLFDSHGRTVKSDKFYFDDSCEGIVVFDINYQKQKILNPSILLGNINKHDEAYYFKNLPVDSLNPKNNWAVYKTKITDTLNKMSIPITHSLLRTKTVIKDSILSSLANKNSEINPIEKSRDIDSLIQIIRKEEIEMIKNQLLHLQKDLVSIFKIQPPVETSDADFYVFSYPNKEHIHIIDQEIAVSELFKKYHSIRLQYHGTEFQYDDKVTTDNALKNGGGGRGSDGFDLFKYRNNDILYYKLNVGGQSTRFKFKNDYSRSKLMVEYVSTDTVIIKNLQSQNASQSFIVTLIN